MCTRENALFHASRQTHPDDNGTGLVGSTNMEVRALRNVIEEELQEIFGFFILEPNDTSSESLVDVECLFASDWVSADDGVLNYLNQPRSSSARM